MRLGTLAYEPRPIDYPIAVYDRSEDVPRPFAKVARVAASGSDSASFASVVEVMRADVRSVGGDALVLLGGGRVVSGIGECGRCEKGWLVHGLAVRWTDG